MKKKKNKTIKKIGRLVVQEYDHRAMVVDLDGGCGDSGKVKVREPNRFDTAMRHYR